MKKDVISKLLIIFVSIIILTGFTSADGCTIRESCESDEYRVIGLSAQTNAHGQLNGQTPEYDYVLCCDFGGGITECTGTNKIIGLSSSTNAHAEITGQDNYSIDVCYDGLTCISEEGGCTDDNYLMEIFSLSGSTNSHIGAYNDYDINICCNKIVCRDEVSLCGDYYNAECDTNPCEGVAEASAPPGICDDPTIDCYCELPPGATEEGSCNFGYGGIAQAPSCGDGIINSELGETCDGENIPESVSTCTNHGCTGGVVSCYAPGDENECTLNVSGCTGCVVGGFCGNEIIELPNNNGVYETCDNESLNSKTCEDFSLLGEELLACYSPTHANNCTFDTTGCKSLHPSTIGKCTYDDSTEDNCDDKFLTYNWTANWTWSQENIDLGLTPPCEIEEGYVEDDGACYYDPNNAIAKCVDGYDTVPCPAQIELPFFGSYSVIIIIALIALVYVFLNSKKGKKILKKVGEKKSSSKRKR